MKKLRLFLISGFIILGGISFAAEVTVPSGEDIQTYIDAAQDGDVLVLADGGHYESESLNITKSLTIKAPDGYAVRPVVSSGSTNHFTFGEEPTGAEVILKGIEFSSTGSRYFMRLEPNDSLSYLEMTDVVAHGYDRCLIRASNATVYLDSLLIDNCHFYNFTGGDYRLFYLDSDGPLKYFKAVNSTFENFDRTFLQLSSANKKTVILDHCNIHRRIDSRDDDLVEIRGEAGSSISISNCIISDIRADKIWDISDDVTDTIMNVFYHNINNTANMTANTWSYSAAFTETDPMFSNAAEGALYLDPASPALTASTTGGVIGDPRWATSPNAASLLRLTIDVGTLMPSFNTETLAYTATLPYQTTSATVSALANYANATVADTGTVDVSSGSGVANVVVTAEGGTPIQTYTITMTVAAASTDATLSSLSIDPGTLSPVFDPAVLTYTASVAAGTDTVLVSAEPADENATYTVTDTVVVSSGSGVATVVVTAQDGTTIQTYTVNITVSGTNVELNVLNKIDLYYNSGSDQIKILNSTDVERIEIFSITGQLLRSIQTRNQENLEISANKLLRGVYIVRMSLTGNKVQTVKISK